MKILIYTNHFYPENFKVNDIAFDLANRGEDVTVITCIPNYPQGSFFKGYGFFKRRKETINGVKVIRLPLIPRGKASKIQLIANYVSYFLSTFIFTFFHCLFNKYDAIFVHETSPIFIGLSSVLAKKMQSIPLYFWVLDLWPESAFVLMRTQDNLATRLIVRLVAIIYNNSDKILISSKGFRKSILEKGDYDEKIVYLPNWAEEIFEERKFDYNIPQLPEGFRIVYGGNIGLSQDIDNLLKAALLTKDYPIIKWIIVGDGQVRKKGEDFVKQNNLESTVHFLGRFPIDAMPAFYNKSDVALITLQDSIIHKITVPARLQSYMAVGKPVIGMVSGETAEIIEQSECGLVCKSRDYRSLASNAIFMYKMGKEKLNQLGEKSLEFYNSHFKREKMLDRIYFIITSKS